MKSIFKILTLIFVLTIISCSKESIEDPYQPGRAIVIKKSTNRIESLRFGGSNEGKTTFYQGKDGSKTGKNGDSDFFISQYPLVEHKYEINIQYDSINEYVLDSITNDTISVDTYLVEVSRDTIGFEEGPIWLALDEKVMTSLLIGIPNSIADTTKVFIKKEVIDTLPVEQYGLLFNGFELNGEETEFTNQFSEVDNRFIQSTQEVPIFDENGVIVEYKEGIDLQGLILRNFGRINGQYIEEANRKLKITIKISDGREIESVFDLKFVPQEVYEARQCWLDTFPGCENNF